MGQFVTIGKACEVGPGTAKAFEVSGKDIAVFNLEGEFYAIGNLCTHVGGPLSEGAIEGGEVTCPWHGAIFNIKTGQAVCLPASRAVESFKTRVKGDDLEIEV